MSAVVIASFVLMGEAHRRRRREAAEKFFGGPFSCVFFLSSLEVGRARRSGGLSPPSSRKGKEIEKMREKGDHEAQWRAVSQGRKKKRCQKSRARQRAPPATTADKESFVATPQNRGVTTRRLASPRERSDTQIDPAKSCEVPEYIHEKTGINIDILFYNPA